MENEEDTLNQSINRNGRNYSSVNFSEVINGYLRVIGDEYIVSTSTPIGTSRLYTLYDEYSSSFTERIHPEIDKLFITINKEI